MMAFLSFHEKYTTAWSMKLHIEFVWRYEKQNEPNSLSSNNEEARVYDEWRMKLHIEFVWRYENVEKQNEPNSPSSNKEEASVWWVKNEVYW